MTRYERFKRIFCADLPRVPWFWAVAGFVIGTAEEQCDSLAEWVALTVAMLLTIVCAVWLVALVIDAWNRLLDALKGVDLHV